MSSEVIAAIKGLENNQKGEKSNVISHAYMEIIIAKCMKYLKLVDKKTVVINDIIYQTMSYIADHFKEPVTLTDMAYSLGVSPYVLSKVFSGTFHSSFKKYLNSERLDYASALLLNTNKSVTEASFYGHTLSFILIRNIIVLGYMQKTNIIYRNIELLFWSKDYYFKFFLISKGVTP